MLDLSLIVALSLNAADPARSHTDCAALSAENAAAGLDYAEAWLGEGGGHPAQHCLALATLAMDRPADAGTILMELAVAERQDPGVAARLYLQAAEAFMAGNEREQAIAAIGIAHEVAGDQPEIHITAAGVYATANEWPGVVRSLNALEKFAALSADALALRGRAHFALMKYEMAARDASAALAIDPYLIDAIVLRGDLLNRGTPLPDDPFAP